MPVGNERAVGTPGCTPSNRGMEGPMRARLVAALALIFASVAVLVGCADHARPPAGVGENFPGTCLPAELTWPTDFIESLPGESSAVAGRLVGVRLEYVESEWVWRLRSAAQKTSVLGETVDDPSFGRDAIVDARTLAVLSSQDTELTPAEQQVGTSAYDAAQQSGEQWPSPLIIEMIRVIEDGEPVWRITTCDTETSEQLVQFLP